MTRTCLFLTKIIGFVASCHFMVSCGPPAGQVFDPAALGLREGREGWRGGDLQTYSSGVKSKGAPVVIFVHGSPGKASNWARYLADSELKECFRMIAYDRPGYGETRGPWVPLDGQISALESLMEKESGPITLVGHSLGGPVILGASADSANGVTHALVLAGSADPRLGPTRPLNAFLKYSGLQYILPRPLRISNEEVHALQSGLKDLEKKLGTVTAEVTVIQGKKDMLVPFQNVAYLKHKLSAGRFHEILLEDEGHFLPWRQYELVKREILSRARK